MSETTRTCTTCKKTYSATTEYFHRDKNSKYGLRSKCKPCRKKYVANYKKRYRQENRKAYERDLEYNKVYKEKHKERLILAKREYYQKNREKCISVSSETRKKNKDKINEQNRNNPKRKAIDRAQRKGLRDNKCSVCGETENLHFHHTNYEKNEGFTLCKKHHTEEHNEIRRKECMLKRNISSKVELMK